MFINQLYNCDTVSLWIHQQCSIQWMSPDYANKSCSSCYYMCSTVLVWRTHYRGFTVTHSGSWSCDFDINICFRKWCSTNSRSGTVHTLTQGLAPDTQHIFWVRYMIALIGGCRIFNIMSIDHSSFIMHPVFYQVPRMLTRILLLWAIFIRISIIFTAIIGENRRVIFSCFVGDKFHSEYNDSFGEICWWVYTSSCDTVHHHDAGRYNNIHTVNVTVTKLNESNTMSLGDTVHSPLSQFYMQPGSILYLAF